MLRIREDARSPSKWDGQIYKVATSSHALSSVDMRCREPLRAYNQAGQVKVTITPNSFVARAHIVPGIEIGTLRKAPGFKPYLKRAETERHSVRER